MAPHIDARSLRRSAFADGNRFLHRRSPDTGILLLFALMAVVGLAVTAVSLFLPVPAVIAGIGGMLLLVGGAGLIGRHRHRRS